MILFVFVSIALVANQALAATTNFSANGEGGASQLHLTSSNGALPTYRGSSFGGSASYTIDFKSGFAIGPYISVSRGVYENTANTKEFSEEITTENLSYGLILGVHYTFFSGGLLQTRLKNTIRSDEKIATLESYTLGGQVAAGLNIELFSGVSLGACLFSNFGSFEPNVGGFSQSTHFVEYGARANLKIPLPSGNH